MDTAPHILVVDDDPDTRELYQVILGDAGYRVTAAADGAAALYSLRESRPVLILLDVDLRGHSGITFAQVYREAPGPHAPIIVVSALRDIAARAAAAGAVASLEKPFDLDQFVALVHRYAAPATAPCGHGPAAPVVGGAPA